MPTNSSPKPKMHLVIGKIYADWCGYCHKMKPAWDEMIESIKEENHLIEEEIHGTPLKSHKRYVSKDGNTVVEIIEIESESLDDELPYVQKEHSPEISMQGGFPTIFKVLDNKVSYYGGERTAKKMKEWCINMRRGGGYTRRKHRKHRTRKNRTRGRYTRTRK